MGGCPGSAAPPQHLSSLALVDATLDYPIQEVLQEVLQEDSARSIPALLRVVAYGEVVVLAALADLWSGDPYVVEGLERFPAPSVTVSGSGV